jgi:DNA-binding response OmpR family regulator
MNDTNHSSILLLDDDKFLLDMYATKFSREGFAVQSCLSAADALTVLRRAAAPDAIVFDLIMPDIDGFAFLQTLRDEHLGEQSLKVALTNQGSDEEKKKVTDLGADVFIVKSTMIPSEVVETLKKSLAGRARA